MRDYRRLFSLALTIVMLLSLMVGCQSPTASSNDKETSKNNGSKSESATGDHGKTLNLYIPNYYNDVEKQQWAKVVEKFKELNPGVNVNVANGDVQVESGKLPTLLQSGVEPPDAILMNAGPGRVSVLSNVNLIQPLNKLYEKNNWKDQLRPFAYDLISGEKNIYELPHMVDAIGFFYNKDVFEQHGIKVPTTKDEFLKALQTLKDKGVAPITVGARNGYAIGWLFGVMLESAAGTEKVEELLYGNGKWNDPEIVKVAEMMADWVKKGYITKESVTQTQADSKFRFLSKKAAMEAEGTYLITDLVDQKLQSSVNSVMMPSFIEGKTAKPVGGIGLTWVIPTKAKDVDLAEKWFNFIVSKDYSQIVLNLPDYNFVPASKASIGIEPAGEVLKTSMKNIENGSGYNPSVFMGVEAKEAYYQNLQGLVGGLTKPKEAMDNIEAAAEKDRAEGFKLNKK
ncbi:extracellular solute-binding protein [Paenibacillus sp. BSR1-1]|uniref:ABC transporter substrate-binding protein n=1 Tax=Paenibacillus sp. BSR1-1 TaxID=3020845 RepID=UPI0025B22C59|nr:extracellular solute-binding protein [Paenibacillus sp. BSR1-1]MDN3015605.1 extracellular solute-binding protein [Paenibacillus sp. BSR1-1]